MEFVEFQIRAWLAGQRRAQVLVHSSPAGCMRTPVTVDYPYAEIEQLRRLFISPSWFAHAESREQLARLGRLLWPVLLPRPVYALLASSLEQIGPDRGLRVRLCLDQHLIDLPWEYAYDPHATGPTGWNYFLFLDERISVVREPPIAMPRLEAAAGEQRMVFAGAYRDDGADMFEVDDEARLLTHALHSVGDLLRVDVIDAADENIDLALMKPAAIFHYAGHTDVIDGRGSLARQITTDEGLPESGKLLRTWDPELRSLPLDAEELGKYMRRARTRLAVFNACNSGLWGFVEPILLSGVIALIGAQGYVSSRACIEFCSRLYTCLVKGMSLDEAVTWARVSVREKGWNGRPSPEWGVFMVYLPSAEVVLFPAAEDDAASARRDEGEQERARSVAVLHVGSALGNQMNERRELRRCLTEAYNVEQLETLCADLEEDLAADNVHVRLRLDLLGGEMQENKVLNLVTYLNDRGYLPYLSSRVRAERPGFFAGGTRS